MCWGWEGRGAGRVKTDTRGGETVAETWVLGSAPLPQHWGDSNTTRTPSVRNLPPQTENKQKAYASGEGRAPCRALVTLTQQPPASLNDSDAPVSAAGFTLTKHLTRACSQGKAEREALLLPAAVRWWRQVMCKTHSTSGEASRLSSGLRTPEPGSAAGWHQCRPGDSHLWPVVAGSIRKYVSIVIEAAGRYWLI